jgi:Cu/Ag efflux pump CusA
MRLGSLVSAELLKNPNVRLVAQQIGRAEQGDDTAGVHYSEIHVDLKPLGGSAAKQAEMEVRETLAKIPRASFSTKTFLTQRMEEVVSGARAQVVVQVFGADLDVIDQKAQDGLRLVASLPGAVDTQLESPAGTPEMVIRLRPEALRQFDFQPVTVLEAIQAAYQGATVGQAYDANRVFNVVGVLAPGIRQHPDRVGQLPLHNLEGVRVPLQVARGHR